MFKFKPNIGEYSLHILKIIGYRIVLLTLGLTSTFGMLMIYLNCSPHQNIQKPFKLFLNGQYTNMFLFFLLFFFFNKGFLLQRLTSHRKAGEGREASFVALFPLCHFHPLTNIQIFISTLHVR